MGEQVESIRRMLESIPKARVTRRGFVMTALTTGFALAVRPISAQTVTTDADSLTAGEVKIPTSDGSLPAYRAMPSQGGPFAAVISFAGFLIVVTAMWISGRRDRRRKPADVAQRRAA